MLTEIQADALAPILIGEFDYEGDVLRAWTGIGDLAWAGYTWLGVGHILGISEITETTSLRAEGAQFTLSAVEQSQLATVLGYHYQGRPAKLWLGALDDAGQLVTDPVLIFQGRMDTLEIGDDAESATLTQSVESELIDLRRARGRRYTDETQRAMYPGDRGLEFIAGLQDKAVRWGN
jgi:hypothetical protein